jgi:hypothetical protein
VYAVDRLRTYAGAKLAVAFADGGSLLARAAVDLWTG